MLKTVYADIICSHFGPLLVLAIFTVLDQLIETMEPELRYLRSAWELVILGLGAQIGLLGTITTKTAHNSAEVGLYYLLTTVVMSVVIVMIRKYVRDVTSAKLRIILVDIAFSLGVVSIVLPTFYVISVHRTEGTI